MAAEELSTLKPGQVCLYSKSDHILFETEFRKITLSVRLDIMDKHYCTSDMCFMHVQSLLDVVYLMMLYKLIMSSNITYY